MTRARQEKLVGPLIRGVDAKLADAVITAVEIDNPDCDVVVDDAGGYVRVNIDHRCVLTRRSLSDAVGRDFALSELEMSLAGFAGRMSVTDDEIVWFLERVD
jgi:toluene monooxygenase system protein D